MNAVEVEKIIDRCLQRLEDGEDLEAILSSYPDQADELRPLLVTALDLHQYAASLDVPQSAQSRSRAQFLTAAAGMEPARSKWRMNFGHLRLATSTLLVVAILVAVLLGTGFASADALPGDALYPVKLIVEQVQINMVQDPPARLAMEENYDDRRLEEVVRLSELQRRRLVTFSGFLQQNGENQWRVGTLELKFSSDIPDPKQYKDAYVEVTGYSDNQVVDVVNIGLRQLAWQGVLQSYNDQSWVIGGVTIDVNRDTQISGSIPQEGAEVQVVAVRPNTSSYLAVSLDVSGMAYVRPSETERSTEPGKQPTLEPSGTPDDGEFKSTPYMKATPTEEQKCSDDCEKATPQPTQEPTQVSTTETGGGEQNKASATPQSSPTPTRRSEDGEKSKSTATPTTAPTWKATRTPTPTPAPTDGEGPTRTPTSSHDD